MKRFRTRLLEAPKTHFFLLGPRGTGKSLWTEHVFPDAVRIDLLDAETFRLYAARPERLSELITSAPAVKTVVIDEVQKLPTLLETAHQLISRGPSYQFVFTGSSARKLRRGNVNLLGGLAVLRTMHPYVAAELGEDFHLDTHLQSGLVPVVVEATNRQETLKAYNALYIREEVFAEGLVRNTEHFTRFLEAISFSQGSILNITNVARDCSVPRKTVESFIEILEDLLIAFRLMPFTKHAKRQLAVHPKFYFFDVGVYRANRPSGPLDDPRSIDGIALESLVAQHLRARRDISSDSSRLYFWRTKSGVEVDFVVYGPEVFEAIEVKNSRTVRPEDVRGLRSFRQDYPEAKGTLLYRGKERLLQDGVSIVPIEEWLMECL